MMTEQDALSFFKENFPLVKIIAYDKQSKLFYDARANMVFVVDNEDVPVVAEYLQHHDKDALHCHYREVTDIDGIIERIDSLQNKGVLLQGPAERLISTEPKDVQARIDYYMENILMRKYVLETTQQCNFRCRYCHNTLEPVFRHHTKKQMTFPVAKAAIDFYKELYLKFYRKLPEDKKALLLKHYAPFIGFYGGEPSLNWKLVEDAVNYCLNLDWMADGITREALTFSVNTNLYILTDEMMAFIMKYKPMLFISLDGPKEDNDRNRVTIDGKGTFDRVFANINRIKSADPEYFKEKIMLLCVEAEGNDTDAVHELLDSFGCPVDYLGEQPYGCLERDPEGEITWYDEHEDEMIEKKLEKYKKRLAENDADALDEFTSLYFLDSVESDTPYMRQQLSVNLTCPLCVDNIMVDVDGGMHICHKTDGSLPLGNVCDGGYDMQKMFEAYRSYGATTNCKECRNCWAMNMCSYCAALRLDGGKWKNPRPSECELQRRRVEYQLKLFVALYKLDPDFYPKLMERKHNLEHYKSIVDYNEFIKYVEQE